MLHPKLIHPESEDKCEFHAPLADDISGLIDTLKRAVADA